MIGLLAAKGQSLTGQDQDDVVLIPLSTAKKRVLGTSQAGAGAVGMIMLQAAGPSEIQAAENQVRALLRQRHHLQTAQDEDFTIRNLEEVFAAQETAARVMACLLAVIASVSRMYLPVREHIETQSPSAERLTAELNPSESSSYAPGGDRKLLSNTIPDGKFVASISQP